jgi:hypothetical protein
MNISTKAPIAILSKDKNEFDVAVEKTKFSAEPKVRERGIKNKMHLGKHQRTEEGRFRRERADSLVKNLKKEYSALHDINGNMKLGTLRDKLGVQSLSQVLKKLDRR